MQNGNIKSKQDSGIYPEIAPGVYCVEVGKGVTRSNVYFIRSGSSWVLVDTASIHCGSFIKKAAESIFGDNTRPECIVITHAHPDHEGAALELARIWDCKIYLHPDDLPLCVNKTFEGMRQFASPLDRWIVFPILRLIPRRKLEAMLLKDSLEGVAQALNPSGDVPGLPEWKYIHTPGHMPGHIAIFRAGDKVLITGDAIVTANLNSVRGMLLWSFGLNKPGISGPPWYSTVNWPAAKQSAAALAKLEPLVLATGHGVPMSGEGIAPKLTAFAERFSR